MLLLNGSDRTLKRPQVTATEVAAVERRTAVKLRLKPQQLKRSRLVSNDEEEPHLRRRKISCVILLCKLNSFILFLISQCSETLSELHPHQVSMIRNLKCRQTCRGVFLR